MENKVSDDSYNFRIYNISKKKLERFNENFYGLNFEVGQLRDRKKIRKRINRYTITVNLCKKQKYEKWASKIIIYIKENKIPKKSYGLWISISEYSDIGGLSVPEHVLKFYFKIYSKVGGQLDFSYIFIDK